MKKIGEKLKKLDFLDWPKPVKTPKKWFAFSLNNGISELFNAILKLENQGNLLYEKFCNTFYNGRMVATWKQKTQKTA